MRRLLLIAAAAALTIGVIAVQPASAIQQVPSTPTSTTEQVTPYVLRNDDGSLVGPGGNVSCDQVGSFDYQSDRSDYEKSMGSTFAVPIDDVTVSPAVQVGTATVTVNPDKSVDWSATIAIEAVIVKGGNDANIYAYGPGVQADTGLGAPTNEGGQQADLSNVTFCSNPQTPPPAGQWCSPGYWRQPHHLDSWAATGIAPSELYLDYFAASTLKKGSASKNPTLLQVLRSPQTYGGEAFNNVGDLLSAAHPDVNWSMGDERVEDSCPLS